MDHEDFIQKTRTAAEHLLAAKQSYLDELRNTPLPVLTVRTKRPDHANAVAVAEWLAEQAEALRERAEVEERYYAETAALAVICGALLQLAFTGVQLCGPYPERQPPTWSTKLPRIAHNYCVGRERWGVPTGLLVYPLRWLRAIRHRSVQLRQPGGSCDAARRGAARRPSRRCRGEQCAVTRARPRGAPGAPGPRCSTRRSR